MKFKLDESRVLVLYIQDYYMPWIDIKGKTYEFYIEPVKLHKFDHCWLWIDNNDKNLLKEKLLKYKFISDDAIEYALINS